MAVQPIDLQVLFSRLNEIGRDQSAHRETQLQAQMVAASEIAQRSEELGHRVTETRTDGEGPEQVNDESDDNASGGEREGARRDATHEQHVFSDPDLGQNVDISG